MFLRKSRKSWAGLLFLRRHVDGLGYGIQTIDDTVYRVT
jgi:hypothetical protein